MSEGDSGETGAHDLADAADRPFRRADESSKTKPTDHRKLSPRLQTKPYASGDFVPPWPDPIRNAQGDVTTRLAAD